VIDSPRGAMAAMTLSTSPRTLGDSAVRETRRTQIDLPHVAPLNALRGRIAAGSPTGDGVPYFDPHDGGINARILMLAEAPGPAAVGKSGFISCDNPDATAANAWHAYAAAGIPRGDIVRWNAVPWYIGSEGRTKIRAATVRDLRAAEPHLRQLLTLLPRLRVVVLCGRKAQRMDPAIRQAAPHVHIVHAWHPSPVCMNRYPQRKAEFFAQIAHAARLAGIE